LARLNLGLERTGFRLERIHYYSDVPGRRELAQTRDGWAKQLTMTGMDWDLDEQLMWLGDITEPFLDEVNGLDRYRDLEAGDFGPGYGPIESQLLHCVIRELAPKRVVEIGSGLSTMVTMHASRLNAAEGREVTGITCVEPYPRDALRREGDIDIVASRAQDVPMEVFTGLEPGDVLFIDSTHAVKTGSELGWLYLEVIPRLSPGVIIHVHDIFLPYTYASDVLFNLFDWQETTLLAALLTGNEGLGVLACLSALHHDRTKELQVLFPDYEPCDLPHGLSTPATRGHFPSSLWLVTSPQPGTCPTDEHAVMGSIASDHADRR
jgi:predicted O-methyltransferase YrrM